MDYLNELNEKQKEAVLHTEGPLLVVAGAGTGKTKTLTYRILHLIKNGVAPERILAITFTNKAAKEMLERVTVLLGKTLSTHEQAELIHPSAAGKPFISTFHALGVHILRHFGEHIGVRRHFSIFDRNDSLAATKEALKTLGIDPKQTPPEKILKIISDQKGKLVTVAGYAQAYGNSYPTSTYAAIWEHYEKNLARQNAVDFDDLILKPALLLQKEESVRDHYQSKWTHVHIDEYQDTNAAQHELISLIAEKHKNICAVGDGDQCIYGWRGADIRNILNFEKTYPGAKTVFLEQNYRSTQTILTAANDVIKKNKERKEKNLYTKNEEGEHISLFTAMDESDEAKFIAEKTASLIQDGVSPKDIAVLYRANFQSRAIEEAFLARSLPYQVLGVKFFDRKEIKDMLAFVRAGLNPESLADIKRIINVPPRGIGKVTLAKIFVGEKEKLSPAMRKRVDNFYAFLASIGERARTQPVSETIKYILKESGLEGALQKGSDDDQERLENIKELVTLAKKYDALGGAEGVEHLLADAALATDQDTMEKDYNAVKLMTVHAAKGLEFPYVFVSGLEDGLFPYARDGESSAREREEERRLFYVAITRAKKKLFLSYASFRTIFGSRQVTVPSDFLIDIDDALLEPEKREGVLATIRID